MTAAPALAYGAVALAALSWAAAAALLPEERRWRRAGGVAIASLFAGAVVWLLVFSAGAALTIARGGGYVPMGEIATAAGGAMATLVALALALAQRKGDRA